MSLQKDFHIEGWGGINEGWGSLISTEGTRPEDRETIITCDPVGYVGDDHSVMGDDGDLIFCNPTGYISNENNREGWDIMPEINASGSYIGDGTSSTIKAHPTGYVRPRFV